MYMSSIYPQFSRAEQLYALRQNLMFNGQYALGKRIRRIPFQNGHAPLHDDAAVIDLLIHKMRRRAGDLRAVSQHGFVNMMPIHAESAERGDERGMNIDDSMLVSPNDLPAQNRQIARQHDQLNLCILQLLQE